MAQLSPTRFRATDANNVPISGAGLFVYQTGTTTKQTLYSDADLTIPRANPVVSVSTGYWAQFYIATGVTVDIQARQTDDVGSTLLWEALEVDSAGTEDNTSFSRDFGANGRLSAVGASGAVRLQFSPPTGDDIGGAAVVSGENGTDLDTGEWRGPLDITGNATIGGDAQLDGDLTLSAPTSTGSVHAKLASGTAAAQTAVDIALDADFNAYILEIDYLTSAGTPNINAQFAFDGVPNFKSGAGDYMGRTQNLNSVTIGVETANSTGIVLTAIASGAVPYGRAVLRIDSLAGSETVLMGDLRIIDGSGGLVSWVHGATNAKGYGKATYVRILTSSSTISFRWALFGIPGL